MKISGKWSIVPIILCAGILLSGCQAEDTTIVESSLATEDSDSEKNIGSADDIISTGELFSDRDLNNGYDENSAVTIQLNGETAVCSSDAVNIDGGRITILDEGTYLFTGTLTDGQVVVNADDSDKVQIVLNGADITSATSAAIYSLEADKLFITLADGTENDLANGGKFQAVDDNNIDSAVFSKTDLTLNGTGSLTVTSPAGHGVVSKDELTITGGSYQVTAANHGFAGKDSVAIAAGSFVIASGKDGIHAENTDDTALGCLYIKEGSFEIDAQGDAISAGSDLQIDDGSFTLTTGGGSAGAVLKSSDMMRHFGQPDAGNTEESVASDTTVSCKGIKADGALTVNNGIYMLDTADDAVHAGGNITICGGEWTIHTGDDGIHSDTSVVIRAGTFSVPYCYEGIEGQSVTIEDGTVEITAKDDGINSAGGTDGSGTNYGFGRQDQFAADKDCFITINGGVITIMSDGDSLDSNGDLTINGGTINLTCNGNGNTAIDTNGTYTQNGGSVTTNDGSENGTGGRGGGKNGGLFDGGEERPDRGEKPAGGERPAGDEKPVRGGKQA